MKKSDSVPVESYTLKTFHDLEGEPPTEWLIRPFMTVDSQVVMFGPPSEGKSFVALSMALSVATGSQWMGHETKRGPVVYVVAEGGKGVRKRVRAWMLENGVENVDDMFFLLEAPQLRDKNDLRKLVVTVTALRPVLIVIDTLARTLVGADENSAQDVGEWIDGAQKLQKETGAAFLTLHHTTKRKAKGGNATERGSGALRGAADTMMSISKKQDIITVSCAKQKDEEPFESLTLTAKRVVVGGTPDEPETSLVMLPFGIAEDLPVLGLNHSLQMALAILTECAGPDVSKRVWKSAIERESGEPIPDRTFMNWVDALMEAKQVERVRTGVYRAVDSGDDAIATEVPFDAIGKAA